MTGPVEQFIIAQAIFKKVAEQVETKDPDNLRGAITQSYRDIYDLTGATSFDLRLGGVKVGTFSFAKTKPEEGWEEQVFSADEFADIWEWATEQDEAVVRKFAETHPDEFARWYFDETGELPDGCSLRTVVHEPTEAGIKGNGIVKLDVQKVAEVMGAKMLDQTIVGYLA